MSPSQYWMCKVTARKFWAQLRFVSCRASCRAGGAAKVGLAVIGEGTYGQAHGGQVKPFINLTTYFVSVSLDMR